MKRFLAACFAALLTCAAMAQSSTAVQYNDIEMLLSGATGTGAGATRPNPRSTKTYQACGATSSGSGAATIVVQGTNGTVFDTIGTITLTLTTSTSCDSFTSMDRYKSVRMNVTAISGTGATINGQMGY